MREDRLENAVLQPLTQPLRVVAASLDDSVEPTTRGLHFGRLKRLPAEEEPPVSEGLIRVGIAGTGQGLDEVHLVEVCRSGVGLPAVESPQAAVGDDDPVGHTSLQGRDDARPGIFLGRFLVAEIRPVEPAVPGVDEGGGERFGRAGAKHVVGLELVAARHLVLLGREAQQGEDRLEKPVADRSFALAGEAAVMVTKQVADTVEGFGRVLLPGRCVREPVHQVVVGKEGPVLEVLLGEGSGLESRPELLVLLQAVGARPCEPAQGPHFQPARRTAVDRERARDDLEPCQPRGPGMLAPPFVEEDELQDVEVGGQDQQVVDVGPAERPGQVVAALGRQRVEPHEHDPQEAFRVLGEEFNLLDGAGPRRGETDRLGRKDGPGTGVIAERGAESRQGIGRRELGDVLRRKAEVGFVWHWSRYLGWRNCWQTPVRETPIKQARRPDVTARWGVLLPTPIGLP